MRWNLFKICALIFVLSTFLSFWAEGHYKCKEVCGNIEEGGIEWGKTSPRRKPTIQLARLNVKQLETSRRKVINGQAPKKRGPLVLITEKKSKTEFKSGKKIRIIWEEPQCTGTVINKAFVLTAAHCFCDDLKSCNDRNRGRKRCNRCRATTNGFTAGEKVRMGLTINYNARRKFKLFFGLNNEAIPKLHKSRIYRRIREIIIHEHFDENRMGPDLAILRIAGRPLKWDLKVSSDHQLSPICLPGRDIKGAGLQDLRKHEQGYTSGWGLTSRIPCFTDNKGPVRNVRCRSPYKIVQFGHVVERVPNPSDQVCSHDKNPSYYNPRCQQFRDSFPKFDWEKNPVVKIIYNQNQSDTLCFNPQVANVGHGWCGTCLPNAKKGENGYCNATMWLDSNFPNDISEHFGWPEDEKLKDNIITRVTWSKNWGFCSKDCETKDNRKGENWKNKSLQETKLNILEESDCQLMSGNSMQSFEFCTGKKIFYPKIPVYKRKFNSKKRAPIENPGEPEKFVNTYKHQLIGNETHYFQSRFERNGKKLDWYIGHTDSCQGDSGGPFFVFSDKGHVTGEKRAYIRGVTSHGGDCAGHNDPGFYMDLLDRAMMRWINKRTKRGRC